MIPEQCRYGNILTTLHGSYVRTSPIQFFNDMSSEHKTSATPSEGYLYCAGCGVRMSIELLKKPNPEKRFSRWLSSRASLGRVGIESVTRDDLYNHDPLAHVWNLFEGTDIEGLHQRSYQEFITDQAERSPDAPFMKKFTYHILGNDLVSDTGLCLTELLDRSLIATARDASYDDRRTYGYEREVVQKEHVKQIMNWYRNGVSRTMLYASLCPEPSEVDADTARLNGFKTDRQLASMWLFENLGDKIAMHAFSLDKLTLARLQKLYARLGRCDTVAGSSLEQLAVPYMGIADGAGALTEFIDSYDELLYEETGIVYRQGVDMSVFSGEANNKVEAKADSYVFYMSCVQAVANSLKLGLVSTDLSDILRNQREAFDGVNVPSSLHMVTGQTIGIPQARAFMDYIRSVAIPHYIFSPLSGDSYFSTIAESGAAASAIGKSYEGACPKSSMTQEQEEQQLASVGFLALTPYEQKVGKIRNAYCVIQGCPTQNPRKKYVKVGGCNVCLEVCQKEYDRDDTMTSSRLAKKYKLLIRKQSKRPGKALGGLDNKKLRWGEKNAQTKATKH